MKLVAVAVIAALLSYAADQYAAVRGVWRAQLDGVPALVMIVSDEGEELTGAILFCMIRRDPGQPPRSTPGLPEPLFNLKLDGSALDFRVSHRRAHPPGTANDPPVRFRLEITGPGEGVLIREGNRTGQVRLVREEQ